MNKIDRTGFKFVNNDGAEFEIIEYRNADDLDVQFLKSGKIYKNKRYCDCERGRIKDWYYPIYFNKGYFDIGKHTATEEAYNIWSMMLQRCYDDAYHIKYPTYYDCFVCNEWLCYQTFADWFYENYIEGYQLDKDILQKDNKIYSPETCCFVPQEINKLLLNHKGQRGEYKIGVSKIKDGRKRPYCSTLQLQNGKKEVIYFETEDEAFLSYKQRKETFVKKLSQEYFDKQLIKENVYQALQNFTINEND